MKGSSPQPEPRLTARQLHSAGYSTRRIGALLGVSAMTVWRWLDEENAAVDRERCRRAYQARRARRKAERAGEELEAVAA